MSYNKMLITGLALAAVGLLSGCASSGMSATGKPAMVDKMTKPSGFSQASLPAAVQVPAGHSVSLETVGVGQITYECRAKTGAAGQFEWVFVGPDAKLNDRAGKQLGKYFGPPATWESNDGSKFTAVQVAVSPAEPGNIPLQLVKTNPAMGSGSFVGTSYVQRVATKGGVAPSASCAQGNVSSKQIVQYQADYIFWKVQ